MVIAVLTLLLAFKEEAGWLEARNGSASSMGRAMKGSTGLLKRVDPVNGTVNNTGRKDIVFVWLCC